MSAYHILFVETQGEALKGAMSVLRQSQQDWRIVLVADPEAALEVLSQRVFSLVIVSFGSNRADCEQFLGRAQNLHPALIRFALLPDQQDGDVTRSLEFAHQCFSSQCGSAEIEAAIRRGLSVWNQCRENADLTGLLSNLRSIPTPPALYFEVRDALDSRDCDARKVADIVGRDPALCAKLLKLANSGFYALPRSVTDIRDAVTFLGTDTVASLLLATHVFNRMPLPGLDLDALWRHSLTVSALARHIAKEEGGDRLTINTAGVAGLLHDLGELILLANVPDIYQSLIRRAGGNELLLLELEREQFRVGHPELGSYVLGLWSLPDAVVEAVALHHQPCRDSAQGASLTNKAVFAAEWLVIESSVRDAAVDGAGEHECPLDVEPDRIEGWRHAGIQLAEQGLVL